MIDKFILDSCIGVEVINDNIVLIGFVCNVMFVDWVCELVVCFVGSFD